MACNLCNEASLYVAFCPNCGLIGDFCAEHVPDICDGCFGKVLQERSPSDEGGRKKHRVDDGKREEDEEKWTSSPQTNTSPQSFPYVPPPTQQTLTSSQGFSFLSSQSPHHDVQSLINLRSDVDSQPEHPLQTIVSHAQPCQQTTTAVHWLGGVSDLSPRIEICPMKSVVLGNSFTELRKAEKSLQKDSNIRIVDGWAATGCPNNALGELRILVANNKCDFMQIRVTFKDGSGNRLLFRSTGGRVLDYVVQEDGSFAYDEKGCRKKKVRIIKDGDVPYVFVGSYSFWTDKCGDKPEDYVRKHDLNHMALMGVQGKSGEHFHHSEQAFFRMLYDHPEILSETLNFFASKQTDFCSFGPIIVHAVALDIFTTRAACNNCKTGATKVIELNSHFFASACSKVSGQFVMAPSAAKLVRIACAVPHNNTPSAPTTPSTKPFTQGVLHALPPKGVSSDSTTSDTALFDLDYKIPVNQDLSILQAAGESRQLTEVERILKDAKTLGVPPKIRSEIPKFLAAQLGSFAQSNVDVYLACASELEMRLEATTLKGLSEMQSVHSAVFNDKETPMDRRLRTVICSGLRAGIPPEAILKSITRNFRDYGLSSVNDVQAAVNSAWRSDFSGNTFHEFSGMEYDLKSLAKADHKAIGKEVQEQVSGEIKALAVESDDGRVEAQRLATDFGLQNVFDEATKKPEQTLVTSNSK